MSLRVVVLLLHDSGVAVTSRCALIVSSSVGTFSSPSVPMEFTLYLLAFRGEAVSAWYVEHLFH